MYSKRIMTPGGPVVVAMDKEGDFSLTDPAGNVARMVPDALSGTLASDVVKRVRSVFDPATARAVACMVDGCGVDDAGEVAEMLSDRWGMPPSVFLVLADEAATQAGSKGKTRDGLAADLWLAELFSPELAADVSSLVAGQGAEGQSALARRHGVEPGVVHSAVARAKSGRVATDFDDFLSRVRKVFGDGPFSVLADPDATETVLRTAAKAMGTDAGNLARWRRDHPEAIRRVAALDHKAMIGLIGGKKAKTVSRDKLAPLAFAVLAGADVPLPASRMVQEIDGKQDFLTPEDRRPYPSAPGTPKWVSTLYSLVASWKKKRYVKGHGKHGGWTLTGKGRKALPRELRQSAGQ